MESGRIQTGKSLFPRAGTEARRKREAAQGKATPESAEEGERMPRRRGPRRGEQPSNSGLKTRMVGATGLDPVTSCV